VEMIFNIIPLRATVGEKDNSISIRAWLGKRDKTITLRAIVVEKIQKLVPFVHLLNTNRELFFLSLSMIKLHVV